MSRRYGSWMTLRPREVERFQAERRNGPAQTVNHSGVCVCGHSVDNHPRGYCLMCLCRGYLDA